MKRYIATAKHKPHYYKKYALMIVNGDKASIHYSDTMNFPSLRRFRDIHKVIPFDFLTIPNVNTIHKILTDPSVILYSEESHPEFFV